MCSVWTLQLVVITYSAVSVILIEEHSVCGEVRTVRSVAWDGLYHSHLLDWQSRQTPQRPQKCQRSHVPTYERK
jgi:hypothetical protein